jgi:2-polyprenyl-3-methyl-5-hydroxy-6-metoxy-1,4-benzoquinol methylase
MKNNIPRDLYPNKIKNYFCPVCETKNSLKKNFFFKSVYKDGSFPGYNHIKCVKCDSLYYVEKIDDVKLSNLHNKYYENWENFSFNYCNSTKRSEDDRKKEWYDYYKEKIFYNNKLKKKNYLDIGCGWGGCVSAFHKLGFKSYGIDPQKQCINFAKSKYNKCTFFNSTVDNLIKNKKYHNYFSIITLHDVLEHIAEPKLLIKQINKLLKKNGKLFIKVPNSQSLQVDILKEYSWEVSPPFHRTLFSLNGLKLLLNKNKFKITDVYNDSNSWGWTRGVAVKNKISKNYEKLRKNNSFRTLDLSIDLLFEQLSKLYKKETVIFLNAKKIK